MKIAAYVIRIALIFALLFGLAAMLKERVGGPIAGAASAIDGDSLRVGGEEIRLSGIDAPEFNQSCNAGGKSIECGRVARGLMQRLLLAGIVTCNAEGSDRYGRTLARCGTREGDLGAAMVAAGHAIATEGYFREEAEARRARRGVWAGDFMPPEEWRRTHKP